MSSKVCRSKSRVKGWLLKLSPIKHNENCLLTNGQGLPLVTSTTAAASSIWAWLVGVGVASYCEEVLRQER